MAPRSRLALLTVAALALLLAVVAAQLGNVSRHGGGAEQERSVPSPPTDTQHEADSAPKPRSRDSASRHRQAQKAIARVQQLSGGGTMRTELAARFDRGVRVTAAGVVVAAVPIGARAAARTATAGGSSTYVDAWPGVDVVQQPGGAWLKESLVLRAGSLGADRRGSFGFELRGRAVPARAANGDITFRDGVTDLALRIPAPRAIDADGRLLPKQMTTFALSGRRLDLRVAVPVGTKFPITVDPTFALGQGADHVIGTSSFDNAPDRHGRDPYAMYIPRTLATDGTRLMVGDYARKRISIFNTVPTADATPQDAEWDGTRTENTGLATNGTRTLVVDNRSHRILVHDAFNGTPTRVLGQPTLDDYQSNFGGRSASSLDQPYGVWTDGTRIAVADYGNNRVLIWTSWPTTNGQAADIVLGQADMTSGAWNRGGGPSANTLGNPRGVYFDGTRFFVADTSNSRVLVWNSFPSSNGQAADYVLGQSAMNRRVCNDAAVAARARLCAPASVNGTTSQLVVADENQSKVHLWNATPTSTAQPADVFVGTGTAGTTRTTLRGPTDAIIIGSKLAVADTSNNRVFLWNTLPVSDSQQADVVLGQTDFTSAGVMGNRGDSWYDVQGLEYDLQGRLWLVHVHERFISRFPATLPPTGAVADYAMGATVPGQPMTTYAANRVMDWSPADVKVADDGTFIATQSSSSSRVTWHPSVPSSDPPPIWSGALGQPTVSTAGINRNGAPAANTLSYPNGADWDGTHFAVADTRNNRVLLWNGMPTTGEAADVVVGQPDFSTTSPNTGGVSANSLAEPRGVRISGGKLYVADSLNHRVLIWNTIPTTNHEPADIVLGQASMFANSNGTSATQMYIPSEVDIDEGMLAVADSYNRRVLLWDTIPTVSTTPADRVIGQANMTSATCSRLRAGLCYPYYIALRDGKLAVNDGGHRIAIYDDVAAPTINSVSAVVAGERATVSWTTDEDASSELVWDTTPHALPTEYAFSSNPAGRRRAHSVSAEPLASGTVYYYRVVSSDARGNATVSAEGTFTASNVTHLQASNGFAADATIDEGQINRNYGGSSEFVIGGGAGSRTRSLIQFDLDQIPAGATVLSATLRLHQTDAGSGTTPTVDAHVVTGEWVEGSGDGTVEPMGTTWTSPDGVDPWVSPGGDIGALAASSTAPATTGAFDLDLTAQLASWISGVDVNAGVLLSLNPEATGETRRFASSEHTNPALRPTLEIEWSGRDVTQPNVANVRTQALSSSSVRVQWDTDELTSSILEYGPTTAYGSQVADPTATNGHDMVLDDLLPSTTYHVRVTATDAQGNFTRSSDVVFRTSYRVRIMASDALLREDKVARNQGAQSVIVAGNMNGSWQRARSALKFDMSVLPPSASIRAATASMVVARQASTATPQMHISPLGQDFVQGTGNPAVGPDIATAGTTPAAPEPLHSSAERHMVLTSSGWWQITPQPELWYSSQMTHRRSYDGFGFSSDAVFGRRTWGKSGTTLIDDGALAWGAGFTDATSTLEVSSYDSASDAATSFGTVAMPAGVDQLPSIAIASDGYVWVKGESSGGQIWVARSSAARNPTAWGAPVQVANQSTPAHASIVALAGGRVLLISQDGGQLASREWNGASWDAPIAVAPDAAVPSPWLSRTSFAAVPDGAGGAWLAYVVAGGGVKAARYSSGSWSSIDTISVTGTAVAISRDRNGDVPVVFWQNGTTLNIARNTGTWSAPTAVPVTLPATTSQLSATPPSDEAIGITWTVPVGVGFDVRWYGLALDKPADGATWNTTDGTTPWASPGADAGAPALATPTAPGAVGGVMSFDLTSAATDWHTNVTPNHGVLLRANTEHPALNDWKAFYSSEAVNSSVRPTLTVDYDLATATFTQPTSATAWRSSSINELRWQVTGSGMTQAEIRYSSDGGATWPNLVDAAAPNTGSYAWTTPPAEGTYRVQIQAKNALGDVIAIGESDPFVIDDTPPDPVTDLAAASPASVAQLTWSEPTDYGGAGMANGTYRIYRSTSGGVLGTRIATVPTAFYDDASSVPDGTYHYTVIPVDAAGNAQLVGNDQIAVERDASQPNAVTDLAGPALTNGSASLTWSAVTDVGAAGMGTYRVYRSATNGVLGTQIGTVGVPGTSDTPPSDGTWYYTVVPVDVAGNARNAGNNQIVVVLDTLAPTATSVLLAGGATWTGTGSVTAALAATGAAQFQVSEDPAFTAAVWTAMAATTPVAIVGDGAHTVYARYRDAAGNVSVAVSDGISLDTTAPAAMASLGVVNPATIMNLSWSAGSDGAGSGVDHYAIYRSATNGVLGGSIGTTATLTSSDTPPSDGTWYYTVRAVDLMGNERSSGDSQVAAVFDSTPPSAVVSTAPMQTPTRNPISLTWSAATDATTSVASYRIYRSASAGPLGALVATETDLDASDTPPSDGTWFYTVRAVDIVGNEQTGGNAQVSAVYDSTAPSAVVDTVVATSPTNGPIGLSWSAATDALGSVGGYRVYRSASSGALGSLVASPVVTSAADTPPSNGTWYYTVQAVDALGNERATGNVQVSAIYDTVAPTPDPMTGTALADSTTQITWTASVASDPNGLGALPYSVDSGVASWQAARNVTVTGLSANTQYSRTVRARDAAGNVSTGTVARYTWPNEPTAANAVPRNWAPTGYRVRLGWTAPAGGAASYNVRSSADGYMSVVLNTASTLQTITGLAPETTYTYKICAVNADGAEETTCSSTVSATTALAPPVSASAANVTMTSVDFDWPDVTNAAGYEVYLYSDAACTSPIGGGHAVAASNWNATGLDLDRYYAFEVRTVDGAGFIGAPTACRELPTPTKRTSIGISVDSASSDLGHGLPGDSMTSTSTVTVDTYGSPGYALHASLDHQPTLGVHVIPATGSGTPVAPGPWVGDGFGITVVSGAGLQPKWAAGTNYAALTTTPTEIHATGAILTPDTSNSTTTTLRYRMDIPATQQAGEYSTTISYTAVPSI